MFDTMNWQLVGGQGDQVVVMTPKTSMSREQAILHAVWLLEVAVATDEEFESIRDAVRRGGQ